MAIGFLHILGEAKDIISNQEKGMLTVSLGNGLGSGKLIEPSCTFYRNSVAL